MAPKGRDKSREMASMQSVYFARFNMNNKLVGSHILIWRYSEHEETTMQDYWNVSLVVALF